MNHWLLKSDPEKYCWDDLVKEKKTAWTGVRNFQARNFLRAMKKGDQAFFYHSQSERAIVGVVEIIKAAYPDPTAKEGDWICVDLKPFDRWNEGVSLCRIREAPTLQGVLLIRQSRLSVMPIEEAAWKCIQSLRG